MGFLFFQGLLIFLKNINLDSSTILWLILFAFIGALIAYYQYYFKKRKQPKHIILLFSLKALSLFFLIFGQIAPLHTHKARYLACCTPLLAPTSDRC